MKSVEREKSEFVESQLTERRNEVDRLKQHHRFPLQHFTASLLMFTTHYRVWKIHTRAHPFNGSLSK